MGGNSPSTVNQPFSSVGNTTQNQTMTGNLVTGGSQTFTPSPEAQFAGSNLSANIGNLQRLYNQKYPGQKIAGFDPTQEAALQQVYGAGTGLGGMVGQGQNAVGQGMWGTYQAGQGLTGEDVGSFYNPMADNITAQMQNIFGQQNAQTTGNAAKTAGGVGASRIGVAQGNLANQQALAAGQTYAGLYQNALQAAQQQKQQQLAAGTSLAGLGGNAIQTGMGGLNAAYQTGAARQAQQQAGLNAQYQQQLGDWNKQFTIPQAQGAALQALGTLGGTTTQVGGQQGTQTGQMNANVTQGGTQSTEYPAPSLASQISGLGGLALGAAGLLLNRGGRTYRRGGRAFADGGALDNSGYGGGGYYSGGDNPPISAGASQPDAQPSQPPTYPPVDNPSTPVAPSESFIPTKPPPMPTATPSPPEKPWWDTAAPGVAQNIPTWTGPAVPAGPGVPNALQPGGSAPNTLGIARQNLSGTPSLIHLVPGARPPSIWRRRGGRAFASGGAAQSILPYTPMTQLFSGQSQRPSTPGPKGPVNSDLSAITGDIQKFVNLKNLYKKAPFASSKPGVANQATPDMSNYRSESQDGQSDEGESPSNEYQEGGDVEDQTENQDTQDQNEDAPNWGRMLGLENTVPMPTPRPTTFDDRFGDLPPAQGEDVQTGEPPANFDERFGNLPSPSGALTGEGVQMPLPRPAGPNGEGAVPLPTPRPASAGASPLVGGGGLGGRGGGGMGAVGGGGGFMDRLSDPRRLALIQMGLGMAAASGQRDARGLPMSPLAVIGQGGTQGLQAFQTARAANLREQMERRRMAHEGSAEGRAQKTLDEAIRWHNFQMSAPVKTGEDIMGRPTYSQRDKDGNLIPIDTKGQRAEGPVVEPDKAASLNGEVLTPGKNVSEGTNPEVLVEAEKEEKGLGTTVRAIAEGRANMASVKFKDRTMVSNLVNRYDPSWNQQVYLARQRMQNELTTNGNAGKLILATNQLLPHIKTAVEQVDELDNSNYPAQNAITNWIYTQTGDPRVKKFNTVREVAAMDAARLLRGSGQMAEKDIDFWRETLAASSSPKQLKETLGLLADDLMGARMSSIEHQYRTIMGKEPPILISPEARDSLTYIRKASGKGEGAGWAGEKDKGPLEGAGPNQKQIDYLKANPNFRDDFDKKFGPGSAGKVLGG